MLPNRLLNKATIIYAVFLNLVLIFMVQRMVISLSSDKAVWDAVMNNEVVRELRESVTQGSYMLSYFFYYYYKGMFKFIYILFLSKIA